MASNNAWPELLAALLAGAELSAGETSWAMGQMMTGEATSAQIAAFIVALRAKGETPAEVTGLVEQMLEHAVPLDIPGPKLDVVGTGGDLAHTVNISTMSALVAAAAGARVVKHGNRAASSKSGSADVLEALGVVIDLSPASVAACVEEVGIGFCFAPVFHPAMRYAGAPRREIGVPTVFNILGPLANPGRPTAQLVGSADQRLAPVMAHVLAQRGTHAMVVRGLDGIDEVTVFADTEIWDVSSGANVVHTSFELSRTAIQAPDPQSLRGGDGATNARVAREVFAGQTLGSLGAVRDAVALNAAAALVTWDADIGAEPVGNVTTRISAALPRAYEAIDSGATAALLDRWALFTQQVS